MNRPRAVSLPSAGASAGSGSDPLAELARLIGQNDPFSEFGRDGARRPRRRARPTPPIGTPSRPAPDTSDRAGAPAAAAAAANDY